MRKNKFVHPRRLGKEQFKMPDISVNGDEYFRNGMFCIHISALLDWLNKNPQPIVDMSVEVCSTRQGLDDSFVDTADITRPIIIAEIAPDYIDFISDFSEKDWISRGYICIDGRHRIEKAKRSGLKTLPAVVLKMEQIVPFICEGYDHYVEYWNRKLEERTTDAHKHDKMSCGE